MFVNELLQGGINALLSYDPTIFDNMQLPSGVILDEVVDNIVLKYGNTPLFIPAPEIMKFYIGRWSSKRLAQWERFKAAIEKQYNPIENYNRLEERDSAFIHGHTIGSNNTITYNSGTENKISADNASGYQADRRSDNSGNDSTNASETHSGTDNEKITSKISGNIGVTTSQQMLTSELDLIPRLNLIDYITEDFHQEFCLSIY